jgi:anti-sigma factor RsiW
VKQTIMDCRDFHNLVEPFADGELDAAQRAAAEGHVGGCASCAARVAEVRRLSTAMRRAFGESPAPPALRHRVALAISSAAEPAAAEPRSVTQGPSRWWLAPLAAAALLGFFMVNRESTPSADDHGVVAVGEDPAESVSRVVTGLRVLHRQATLAAATPIDPGPGTTPCGVEREMSRRMCQKVVAPDFSGHGMSLVKADRCDVVGAVGVQVVYRCGTSGTTYSVFTLPRDVPIGACDVETPGGRQYFVTCDENELIVVAWQDDTQTYALCAPRPSEVLLAMADPLRSTCAMPVTPSEAMLCQGLHYSLSQDDMPPAAGEVLLAAAHR